MMLLHSINPTQSITMSCTITSQLVVYMYMENDILCVRSLTLPLHGTWYPGGLCSVNNLTLWGWHAPCHQHQRPHPSIGTHCSLICHSFHCLKCGACCGRSKWKSSSLYSTSTSHSPWSISLASVRPSPATHDSQSEVAKTIHLLAKI